MKRPLDAYNGVAEEEVWSDQKYGDGKQPFQKELNMENRKKIRNWSIAGAVFTLAVGTLLHFVYDWFPGTVTAVFGAVNESTWEHLKLIFWPVVMFGIVEFFAYGKKIRGFLPIKMASLLLGMLTITALFYTYTGVLGFHLAPVDISTFVIGTAAAYFFACRMLKEPRPWAESSLALFAALAVFFLFLVCFGSFSFHTPHLGIFQDPVTGGYGLGG